MAKIFSFVSIVGKIKVKNGEEQQRKKEKFLFLFLDSEVDYVVSFSFGCQVRR